MNTNGTLFPKTWNLSIGGPTRVKPKKARNERTGRQDDNLVSKPIHRLDAILIEDSRVRVPRMWVHRYDDEKTHVGSARLRRVARSWTSLGEDDECISPSLKMERELVGVKHEKGPHRENAGLSGRADAWGH